MSFQPWRSSHPTSQCFFCFYFRIERKFRKLPWVRISAGKELTESEKCKLFPRAETKKKTSKQQQTLNDLCSVLQCKTLPTTISSSGWFQFKLQNPKQVSKKFCSCKKLKPKLLSESNWFQIVRSPNEYQVGVFSRVAIGNVKTFCFHSNSIRQSSRFSYTHKLRRCKLSLKIKKETSSI